MTGSVRYQVFVSSTFTDLKEERAEVIQALWELDCIPTGMEAFVATNESQWEVIQKVINECDYYVLIIGGRYGSITDDGISYTEKEYNYAHSLGIPCLCFVHADVDSIPAGKTEKNPENTTKLSKFRERVLADHPVRGWSNAQELSGVVSRSIARAIKTQARPGWIRNEGQSSIDLLEQINELTKENQALRKTSPPLLEIDTSELASGEDIYTITGSAVFYDARLPSAPDAASESWSAEATWNQIFRDIGPAMHQATNNLVIKEILGRYVGHAPQNAGNKKVDRLYIYDQTASEVITQFRALGLIRKATEAMESLRGQALWTLTELGDRELLNLIAFRKTRAPPPVE